MARVTNTGNAPLFIGTTQVPAHSTVDVEDEELQTAKENKMVESWFANGTLKMGEAEEKPTQTPGNIHPNEPKSTGAYPPKPKADVDDTDK
jgi:hypothetical protein